MRDKEDREHFGDGLVLDNVRWSGNTPDVDDEHNKRVVIYVSLSGEGRVSARTEREFEESIGDGAPAALRKDRRMSRYVDLGIYAESGKPFRGDLDIILRSNVLAQANSGGGKSWLLRRFIEQAFKRVPQIIIDPEGEFSTLRSHFDVVLVGKGGDTPADIRSAKLLAHRLLELGTSAVIDLYEMSKPQRPVWVAAFLSALIDAPKKLWRDFLIYIDEAHEFAPEPGHGTESRDEKVCRHALIDLAAKGRKRGYGVIAATQRLGKLSKDFAAELKNVLIGQTFIDIDRERAAGNLGGRKRTSPSSSSR